MSGVSTFSLKTGITASPYTYFAEGCITDNSTDNYAYLQGLIDRAEAAGTPAEIVLPAGEIVISDTLLIQGVATLAFSGAPSGIHIRGQGMLTTQLRCTKTDGAAIQIGTDSSINGICLSGFGLIGPGKTNAGTIGIDCGSVTGAGAGTWSIGGSFNWQNVWVEAFETGLRFLDNTLGTYVNLNVKDCDIGAKMGYQADIHNFIGCRFDDILEKCIDFTYRDGSGQHDSGSLEQNPNVFLGCRFNANDGSNGAVVFDIGSTGVTNLHVQACYFEDCDKIATLGESGSATGPKNIVFDNCYFTVCNDVNTQFTVTNTNDDSLITIRNCRSDTAASGVSGGWLQARVNTKVIWENNQLPSDGFQIRRTDGGSNNLDYTLEQEDSFRLLGRQKIVTDGTQLTATEYPIEVLMTNGSGENYMHFGRLNGSTGAIINSEWKLIDIGGLGPFADGLVKLNQNASKPSASSTYQGVLWITKGGAGVADTVECCLKSAADTYSWVTVATG